MIEQPSIWKRLWQDEAGALMSTEYLLLGSLLTELITHKEDLNAVARVLNLLAGMYDQASCIAATHRATE